MVVAEPPYAEGQGDSATLELPRRRHSTSSTAVRPLVDRLIVVILSGRPVMLDRLLPDADAVVAAWLPGTEGAGVADVLLGDVPFGGDDAVHLAEVRRPMRRGPARRPCDGAVFPLGYGLDASGSLLGPAACSAP